MRRKVMAILAALGVLLFITAGIFMYQAKQKQAETDALRAVLFAQQKQAAKSVRVILTMGDCSTQADLNGDFFDGHTAIAYCEANGIGDFHPRLETSCFHEGLRQKHRDLQGYSVEFSPTKKDFIALACGIGKKYPEYTEAWDDEDLKDGLRILVNDYLSAN